MSLEIEGWMVLSELEAVPTLSWIVKEGKLEFREEFGTWFVRIGSNGFKPRLEANRGTPKWPLGPKIWKKIVLEPRIKYR